MAIRRWMMAGTVAVGLTLATGGALAALAVFDAANLAENLEQKVKQIEELRWVIETYNKINGIVSWIGNIRDKAEQFANEPLRAINGMTNCLSATQGDASTLCGMQNTVKDAFYVPAGAISDAQYKTVMGNREAQMSDAIRRGVALGMQYRKDAGTAGQALVTLAGEAQSVNTASAQQNMQNKILLHIAGQMNTQNALLASLLEMQGSQGLRSVPGAIGVSKDRYGVTP